MLQEYHYDTKPNEFIYLKFYKFSSTTLSFKI